MADLERENEHIKVETDGHILRLTLNRPDKKNALTQKMYADMARAITHADETAEIRVIYISSSSSCFCSGNDLKDFMAFNQAGTPKQLNPFLPAIAQAQTPIVAAVSGPAVGIGTTLLLHCDLVYAGQSARFQMPFVNLGLCPEAGSSYLLPTLMGHQRASRLILLGESISAQEALEYGIVCGVVEDIALHEHAWSVACRLAEQPPESVQLSRRLLKKASNRWMEEVMADELKHFSERLLSDECAEALTAFFEKRKPKFK